MGASDARNDRPRPTDHPGATHVGHTRYYGGGARPAEARNGPREGHATSLPGPRKDTAKKTTLALT